MAEKKGSRTKVTRRESLKQLVMVAAGIGATLTATRTRAAAGAPKLHLKLYKLGSGEPKLLGAITLPAALVEELKKNGGSDITVKWHATQDGKTRVAAQHPVPSPSNIKQKLT